MDLSPLERPFSCLTSGSNLGAESDGQSAVIATVVVMDLGLLNLSGIATQLHKQAFWGDNRSCVTAVISHLSSARPA